MVVLGIAVGAFLTSITSGSFRWQAVCLFKDMTIIKFTLSHIVVAMIDVYLLFSSSDVLLVSLSRTPKFISDEENSTPKSVLFLLATA
jgi:hypothetical protein